MTTYSTNNPIQFAKFVDILTKRYVKKAAVAISRTLEQLRDDVIEGTPVDTGFARASWYDGNDKGASHPNPPTLEEKAQAKATGGQITTGPGYTDAPQKAIKTGRYFLMNSAAYIAVLNARGGASAPAKWVERARYNFNKNLKANLRDPSLF